MTFDDTTTGKARYKARRLAIFAAWSAGGTFKEIGARFGLSRGRTQQIIRTAIVTDGARSERARSWLETRGGTAAWRRRYDENEVRRASARGGGGTTAAMPRSGR